MGWSGGTYTKGNAGSGGWVGDASLGIAIEASRHDTQDNDFATGINNCLAKDGQNTPTANLGMGGYKHTGVGNASAADEYLSYGQLLDVSKAVTTSGTAPNYTATLTPAPASYYDGMSFPIQIHSTLNVSGATLNVNGLGAKDLKITKSGATTRDPAFGELSSRNTYLVTYNSVLDAFLIANPTFSGGSVSFTTTIGSQAGTAGIISQSCDYQYINGRAIYVTYQVTFSLAGATSDYITFTLPVNAGSESVNQALGSGYVNGITGYSDYGMLAYCDAATRFAVYREDQNDFPIDGNMFFYMSGLYMAA